MKTLTAMEIEIIKKQDWLPLVHGSYNQVYARNENLN